VRDRAAVGQLATDHPQIAELVDVQRLLAGHDAMLAMYLLYDGSI
jgi:hypothetical protein